MKQFFLSFAMIIIMGVSVMAQPRATKVQVYLVPNHADALYKIGENAKVKVSVTDCGMALSDVVIKYEVSEDLMTPHITKSITLKGDEGEINLGTMKKSGYLRVKATAEKDGKKYSTISTVGFEPEKLQPTVTQPDDFKAFWDAQLESARKIDLQPTMTLIPERCTDKVNVYHISYRNINNTRMYGMLTMPKAEGKYPAILRFPGAGVGEKSGDIGHAARGAIILEFGIHGIPVNLTGSTIYSDLNGGALASYPTYNIDNRYSYYYKRVYVGCVRGIDFLASLPQFNGKLGTFGGSQGGALSIVTSALDSRINATVAYFPALCDLEGYTHERAGGWPHVFKSKDNCTPEKLKTARYYDVTNFARNLTAPVKYFLGYNDLTCAPTTTHSTYNIITAPKSLIIGENNGHWLYTEQTNALWDWMFEQLK